MHNALRASRDLELREMFLVKKTKGNQFHWIYIIVILWAN